MTAVAGRAIEQLTTQPASFHSDGDGPQCWNALPGTLRLIARHVRPGARTLETGAGASTVVFAAAGARHTAISPDPGEHERIGAFCREHGIDTSQVSFVAGRSDAILPAIAEEEPGTLDVVFIDGAHAFPFAVVDFHYAERLLTVGGVLVLDDVPIPSVAVVLRHLDADPAWERLEVADDRAAAFRKLAAAPGGDPWAEQPFNEAYPDFSFAPFRRRLVLELRERTRRAVSALARRHPRAARAVRERIRPR